MNLNSYVNTANDLSLKELITLDFQTQWLTRKDWQNVVITPKLIGVQAKQA